MKVLLANPSYKQSISRKYEKYYIRAGSRWPHSGVKRKGTIPHYLPFPFYLGYSATILKNSGFDVHTVDAVALDLSEELLIERLLGICPELFFFEVTTPTINYDLQLINKIKTLLPQMIVVIGGSHATTFSEELLVENPAIDYILKGEYEIALHELATSLRGDGCRPDRGIISKSSNDLLDKFPFPAYNMFPSSDHPEPTIYWDGFCQMSPAIQMQSSRGCPYSCYFCLWNSVMYGHGKYRTIDPVRVVDRIESLLAEYGVKEIYFDDDSFTISRKHVLSICNELLKRNIGVKWSCMADVAGLDESLLQVMAKSGCIGVKFGVESGSEKVLKGISKPVDLEKVKNIVSWCRQLKIKSHATFTIGLLDEAEEDMLQTLEFAKNLGADSIQISSATPLPGTSFFEIMKEKGRLRGKEWETFDGKISEAVASYSGKVNVEKLRKRAMLVWAIKAVCIPTRIIHKLRIISRTVRGMGIGNFSRKLSATIIDELKNR